MIENPLPNDKMLAFSKLKALADYNFNVAQMMQVLFERIDLFGYFRLSIFATGCPSERRPQKTVSCYEGSCKDTGRNY